MPKVRALTPEQRYQDTLEGLAPTCKMILAKNHISQKELAAFMGISPQAVSQQFQKGYITIDTFVAVMNLANVPGEKMERMVSIK